MMARFIYGNEERENKYWIVGEERRCRMCYKEREHIFGIVIFMFVIQTPEDK
jgi:hypothetical protein